MFLPPVLAAWLVAHLLASVAGVDPGRVIDHEAVWDLAPIVLEAADGDVKLAGEALCVAAFESGGETGLLTVMSDDDPILTRALPEGTKVKVAPDINNPRWGVVGPMQIAVDDLALNNRAAGLEDWGYHSPREAVEVLLDPATNVEAALARARAAGGWAEAQFGGARRCGLHKGRSMGLGVVQ